MLYVKGDILCYPPPRSLLLEVRWQALYVIPGRSQRSLTRYPPEADRQKVTEVGPRTPLLGRCLLEMDTPCCCKVFRDSSYRCASLGGTHSVGARPNLAISGPCLTASGQIRVRCCRNRAKVGRIPHDVGRFRAKFGVAEVGRFRAKSG